MDILPLIADESIVAAVSLLDFEDGEIPLTADLFTYDEPTQTLSLTLTDVLADGGYYDLRLDGSLLTDIDGRPLRGDKRGACVPDRPV